MLSSLRHSRAVNDLIEQAVSALARARSLAVLTGAGVSKESGIPTFREAQTGLWVQYDPQELATPQAFRHNPKLVWDWYEYRRQLVVEANPNSGHLALVELEQLVPRVVVLTQNVDGLHQAAGSTDVVELHGNLRRSKCFANCRGDPTLIDVTALRSESREASPPLCPHCGGYVRPDVVWFGETLREAALSRAYQASEECDVMLIVGTSGAVHPAAALPAVAKGAGKTVIEVNPEPSGITSFADLILQGPGGEVLPRLVERVRQAKCTRAVAATRSTS